ncbi:MAG: cadmium resistance transporter [Patescibacteria group bacterium]
MPHNKDMLAILSIAVVAFIATNLDDTLLLIGFFSHKSYKPIQVVIGQYLGIGLLVFVSAIGAAISLSIAPAYVGLLGFLPIVIGAKEFWHTFITGDAQAENTKIASSGKILSIAAVTIANGGDNIGIYIPLFATMTSAQFIVTVVMFAVMTGLLCLAGYWLVYHKRFGRHIQYWGHRMLPFVLIGLGVYILWHNGSTSLIKGY